MHFSAPPRSKNLLESLQSWIILAHLVVAQTLATSPASMLLAQRLVRQLAAVVWFLFFFSPRRQHAFASRRPYRYSLFARIRC